MRWKADETCASDSAFTSTTRFPLWAGQLAHATRAASGREFSTGGSNYGSFLFFCVSPFSPENGTTVNSLAKVTQLPGEVVSRYDPEHRCYMRQGAKMGYI